MKPVKARQRAMSKLFHDKAKLRVVKWGYDPIDLAFKEKPKNKRTAPQPSWIRGYRGQNFRCDLSYRRRNAYCEGLTYRCFLIATGRLDADFYAGRSRYKYTFVCNGNQEACE